MLRVSASTVSRPVARSSTAGRQTRRMDDIVRFLNTTRVRSGDSDGHSMPERSTVPRFVLTRASMRNVSPAVPSVA